MRSFGRYLTVTGSRIYSALWAEHENLKPYESWDHRISSIRNLGPNY